MTNKRIYWIIFAVCQTAGAILPCFGNVHMNVTPIFVGVILLLPGDLVAELFPRMPDAFRLILMVLINFGAWYGTQKVLRLDRPSVSN